MVKTLVLCNFKGGTNKTGSSAQISMALSRLKNTKKKHVLVIDGDPQVNLDTLMIRSLENSGGKKPKNVDTMMKAIVKDDFSNCIIKISPYIDLLSTGQDFSLLPRFLEEKVKDYDKRPAYLRKLLNPIIKKYDYCVIDSGPGENMINSSLFCLGENVYFVIAMQVTQDSFDGAINCVNYIQQIYDKYSPDIKGIVILPTMIEKGNSAEKAVIENARKKFGSENILPAVPYMRRMIRYPMTGVPFGKDIGYYDRHVIEVYSRVTKALLEFMKEND